MQPTVQSAVAVATAITASILGAVYLYTRPPEAIVELPAKPGAPLMLNIPEEICDADCLADYERERGLTPMREPDRPETFQSIPPSTPLVPL